MVKEKTNSIYKKLNKLNNLFPQDVVHTLENMMEHPGDSKKNIERAKIISEVADLGKDASEEKIKLCTSYYEEACGSPLIMRDDYVDFPTSSGYRVVTGFINNAF